jgi:hypothetical protein
MSNEVGRVKWDSPCFSVSTDTCTWAQQHPVSRDFHLNSGFVFRAPTALLDPYHFILMVWPTKHVCSQQ